MWSRNLLFPRGLCRASSSSTSSNIGRPSNGNRVVFITGCDSGLGFSLAKRCYEEGLSVVAACHRVDSDGAEQLKQIGNSKMLIVPLDVTSTKDIAAAVINMREFLHSKKLQAVVNNAGVMVFGEFEWQTDEQMYEQIAVNQMGYFRVAKAFLPILREHQGRLINMSSHCALAGLPHFAVYSSTKAASLTWSDALRIEQAKYGVKVISFMPGSFITSSRILHRQKQFANDMLEQMSSEEQAFYKPYFHTVQNYILQLPINDNVECLKDEQLYKKLLHAILAPNPHSRYKREPMRYWIYHALFKIAPIRMRDRLIERFMRMPPYENPSSSS